MRGLEHRLVGAPPDVAGRELVAEVLDERPERHVFAERDEQDLVVAAGHGAVGGLGDRVVGVGESVGGGFEPAAHDDRVEIGGESGESVGGLGGAEEIIATSLWGGSAIVSGVHNVLGPDDEVDFAAMVSEAAMWRSNTARVVHVGSGVLRPATLDDCDVDGIDRLGR